MLRGGDFYAQLLPVRKLSSRTATLEQPGRSWSVPPRPLEARVRLWTLRSRRVALAALGRAAGAWQLADRDEGAAFALGRCV
jgi:hypothetical protein